MPALHGPCGPRSPLLNGLTVSRPGFAFPGCVSFHAAATLLCRKAMVISLMTLAAKPFDRQRILISRRMVRIEKVTRCLSAAARTVVGLRKFAVPNRISYASARPLLDGVANKLLSDCMPPLTLGADTDTACLIAPTRLCHIDVESLGWLGFATAGALIHGAAPAAAFEKEMPGAAETLGDSPPPAIPPADAPAPVGEMRLDGGPILPGRTLSRSRSKGPLIQGPRNKLPAAELLSPAQRPSVTSPLEAHPFIPTVGRASPFMSGLRCSPGCASLRDGRVQLVRGAVSPAVTPLVRPWCTAAGGCRCREIER